MSDVSVQEQIKDDPMATQKRERLAAWVQFPRRVVLLLIAFGLASALIIALRGLLSASTAGGLPPDKPLETKTGWDWSISWATRQPVSEIIGKYLPNTLLLLGAALFLVLLFALAATIIAVLVHKLEDKTGPLGSILKGLGRLGVFSQAAMPVFVIAVFFILIFGVRLRLLPFVGMVSPSGLGGLGDRIKHLVLPALALAVLPATLAAQAVVREVTLPRERGGFRLWLTGLFKMLGMLLGQIGGLLSATVLVETVFAWPGIGRLVTDVALRLDYPVLLGVLSTFAVLILVGRLLAELARWLERLVSMPVLLTPPSPARWRKTARTLWVVLALVLLVAPLALAIAGLMINPDKVVEIDLQSSNQPPSASHPWGTDDLGRDLQARVLRGGLTTLGVVAIAAVIILLPGLLGGALTGFLASRRVWWAESLADLLLLPADVMIFIPILPAAIVMSMLIGPARSANLPWIWLSVGVAIVLLPRAVRVYQALWTAAPQHRKGLVLGLAGTAAFILGGLFAGFGLVAALDFLGFGIRPPTPALGSVMSEALRTLIVRPERVIASGIVIWICAFAPYTASDALVGFFNSKEALARLNE